MTKSGVGYFLGWLGERLDIKRNIILVYHSIDNSGSVLSESPENFRTQMLYLKKYGFISIPLRKYLAHFLLNHSLPDRTFVLTFDDGYKSIFHNARPVIKELGLHATVFFTSGYAGKTAGWKMPGNVPKFPLMTWDELRILKDEGTDIQSHTVNHPYLTTLNREDIEKEIVENKKEIESNLGHRVDILAYPHGNYTNIVIEVVKKIGFISSVTIDFGSNGYGDDLFRLRRISSRAFINMSMFKACVWGTYEPLLNARRFLFTKQA